MAGVNPKRNHHVVPKLYLKGFVEKPGELFTWMYKKGESFSPGNHREKSNPARVSVGTAGVERDFYADHKLDGTVDHDSFENKLEQLEKPANPIFKKLRHRQAILPEEKAIFAKYIVQMMKRTEDARDWVTEQLPHYLDAYRDHPILLQMVEGNDLEEKRSRLAAILVKIRDDPNTARGTHLRILTLIEQAESTRVIQQMNWHYLVANQDDVFITGDNPVFTTASMGLAHPEAELVFPISSDVALWATWRRDSRPKFHPAPTHFIREFNRRLASIASKYLFASRCEDWIPKILNKADPYLRLLNKTL